MTASEVGIWFDIGLQHGYTHMIVAASCLTDELYPIYCHGAAEVWSEVDKLVISSTIDPVDDTICEVYDLALDKLTQLTKKKAMHLPFRPAKYELAWEATVKEVKYLAGEVVLIGLPGTDFEVPQQLQAGATVKLTVVSK